MKRVITAALLLLAGLWAYWTWMKSDVSALNVMTFNVRYGTAKDSTNSWIYRRTIFMDCLRRHTPDILGTQEALPFQIEEIRTAFPNWQVFGLGRYHNTPAPHRPFESMGGTSCQILFDATKLTLVEQGTYWHSDTPEVPGSMTWGNDMPRITTWGIFEKKKNHQQFVVMNTHFHWGEPYLSKTAELIMRKWREIAGDRPAILMGDFNLDPASSAHELFCGRAGADSLRGNFIDCWQSLGKSDKNSGTSHNYTGTKSKKRIDWILMTPQFNAKKIEIIYDNNNGLYPSDHYPVLACLEFGKM